MQRALIHSIGTALPSFKFSQSDIKKFMQGLFQDQVEDLENILSVYDNTLIQTRYLSQPLEWLSRPHRFCETNAVYEEVALKLAEAAGREALEKARVHPSEIETLLFVSTTGISTPSLDAKLIQKLDLSRHTHRIPVWGLGCAGGVSALARASELVPQNTKAVLLIAVELCSLTFQKDDLSKANIIGTSLFGDGASAVVLKRGGEGPEILGSYSTLFDETEYIMGWDLIETGFKLRISPEIPSLVEKQIRKIIDETCEQHSLSSSQLKYHVLHPGGAKVLKAYEESLKLTKENLKFSYEILRDYGNMSSATVLFILERFLKHQAPSNSFGMMSAFGPGFSAEQVLFRW